jgi:hypothetical protein
MIRLLQRSVIASLMLSGGDLRPGKLPAAYEERR